MSEVGVHSEVGKLRKVMVHRPDLSLQRLTPSNHDALLFEYENGAPLTDADRNAVYQFLRRQGILKHGDTGSFTNVKFRAEILGDGTGGYARAADGKWYYVKYAKNRSAYVNPGDYRQVFDGLPLVPNAP